MFSSALISKHASIGLKEGYTIRPLARDDLGALEVLKVLTTVGNIPQDEFHKQVEYWSSHDDTYFPTIVANQSNKVVACGMLVIERKLIHERGLVGHIEDIAVASDQQGLSLGKHLIQALSSIARNSGCYKVILDCDEKNVKFYEKCGYRRAGVEMDLRF